MKVAQTLTALIAIVLVSLIATTALATESVSPGAVDRMAVVNNACPTFSWGMSGDAVAYELIAYVLPEDAAQSAELTSETEVLFNRVAGSATSWTPSADRCFAPGGRYVWFVRAVNEFAGDEVVAATDIFGRPVSWRLPIQLAITDAELKPQGLARVYELSAVTRQGNPGATPKAPPFGSYWVGSSWKMRLAKVK